MFSSWVRSKSWRNSGALSREHGGEDEERDREEREGCRVSGKGRVERNEKGGHTQVY